jgi:hypothetical protein
LFGETIPFTGDKKFRFFAVPACEALGLQNPTAAIGVLPESEQDTVDIETPEGPRKMRAITEAGLYFLAFTRRRQMYADTHVFAQFIALLDVLWLKLRTQDSSFANNPLAIAFDATIRSASELAMQSSDLPISRCRSKSACGSVAPLGL